MPELQLFKIAVSAFVVQEGSVLLLKRRDDEVFLPGVWEVPGGGMNEGETIEQGVMRETREEAGVEISVGKLFGYFEYVDSRGQPTLNLNFICTLKDVNAQINVTSGEMAEGRWVNASEFNAIPFTSDLMKRACQQALDLH